MKNIISASRRTDIPAFYSDWFLGRLDEGFAYSRNPYSGKAARVSLSRNDLHSVVFWSKDYSPLLRKIEKIERHTTNLFFHFTITGLGTPLERSTPDFKDAVRDFRFISERFSTGRIIWRFDPVAITDKLPFGHYEDKFSIIAELLKGWCAECYISFVEPYKKAVRNLSRLTGQALTGITVEEKRNYVRRLCTIAGRNGIGLYACCDDTLLVAGAGKGRCIDAERLASLAGDFSISLAPAPTREGCGCTRSIDIGAYDTCAHGCAYCYATASPETGRKFLREFDAGWNGLGFNVTREDEEPSLF